MPTRGLNHSVTTGRTPCNAQPSATSRVAFADAFTGLRDALALPQRR
ncbi:hypothetical protein [Streptomyces sp. NPDC006446]